MAKITERKLRIKEAARQLFIENNIEYTTFAQIARKAEVGEATVYRHYSNKDTLAMEIAMDYSELYVQGLKEIFTDYVGKDISRFEDLIDYLIKLYNEHPDYYMYIEHFDNYIVHRETRPEGFLYYEKQFQRAATIIKGSDQVYVWDDSVDNSLDLETMVYTYLTAFISLCQKLLLRGRVLERDLGFDTQQELQIMKRAMVESARA